VQRDRPHHAVFVRLEQSIGEILAGRRCGIAPVACHRERFEIRIALAQILAREHSGMARRVNEKVRPDLSLARGVHGHTAPIDIDLVYARAEPYLHPFLEPRMFQQ
jgi:hypothetical protein